jgi:hypothetical protein
MTFVPWVRSLPIAALFLTFIKRLQSLPSFLTVRNDLKLEEIELDNLEAEGQAFVFYFTPLGEGHPSQAQ